MNARHPLRPANRSKRRCLRGVAKRICRFERLGPSGGSNRSFRRSLFVGACKTPVSLGKTGEMNAWVRRNLTGGSPIVQNAGFFQRDRRNERGWVSRHSRRPAPTPPPAFPSCRLVLPAQRASGAWAGGRVGPALVPAAPCFTPETGPRPPPASAAVLFGMPSLWNAFMFHGRPLRDGALLRGVAGGHAPACASNLSERKIDRSPTRSGRRIAAQPTFIKSLYRSWLAMGRE